MTHHSKDYCDWNSLLADSARFWIGFSKSDVLLAQQSEADLLCLLRRKFGLTDREAMHQISDYLRSALASDFFVTASTGKIDDYRSQ